MVSGVSARAQREIADFEDARWWPGAVGEAMAGWVAVAHGPRRRLREARWDGGCGEPGCCPSVNNSRDVLEQALRVLSRGAARELRALIRPLDERFLARTHPDPHAAADEPWWRRRC
ncbi:hypothetical protein [Nocardia asteroides]|uniref:hypothetical protein n=1 Tax=Nocardia asteroides TaxID=1824 RepID=UPI000A505FF7|nr:hypothetical protein [Nocardia asteroides]UGT49880.1 hypothetical protein LT345_04590 [Nocardia asteroides]